MADAPLLTLQDIYFYWNNYLGDVEKNRGNPYACPMSAKSFAGLPPTFVASAECDPTKDGNEAMAAKLKADDVPTVARCYAGMPHGFYGWVGINKRVDDAVDELCTWLKQQF